MIPKTQQEKEVTAIYGRIGGSVSLPFRQWVEREMPRSLIPYAKRSSRKNHEERWCPVCGQTFTPREKGDSITCPHCHASLRRRQSEREASTSKPFTDYFIVCKGEAHGGWQVFRSYCAEYLFTRGEGARLINLWEVFADWYNPTTGQTLFMGSLIKMFFYNVENPFCLDAPLSLRKGRASAYDGWYLHLYPRSSFVPGLRRVKGLLNSFRDINTRRLSECLTGRGAVIAETLLKTNNAPLLREFTGSHTGSVVHFWDSLVVAMRHGVDFKRMPASDYLDYLGQLERLHLDLRSPHYLVPENFDTAHAALTRRLMTREERERKARRDKSQREELERIRTEGNADYARKMGRLLAVCIVSDAEGISIKPLQTVDDFYAEGKAMNHCVFSNGYYKRDETLILSARDLGGNRLATIELCTRDWRIVQCRGVNNSTPTCIGVITQLINSNIKQFKRAL